MNQKAQSELHPGADLLSAFAERALSEPERARILAHMAGCARCREVVYLAQAAAGVVPTPAAVLVAGPRRGRIAAAFSKWRAALVPAAALAAVGAVVLWVETHPASPPAQTARIVPPLQPASGAATARMASPPAAPASAPLLSAAPPHQVAGLHPAPSAGKRAKPQSNRVEGVISALSVDKERALNAPAPARSAPAAVPRPYGDVHLDGHSASMARFAPAPQPQPVRPSTTWVAGSSHGGPEWQQQQMVQAAPDVNRQVPAAGVSQAPPPGSVLSVNDQLAAPATLDPAQVLQSSQQLERATRSTNGFALMQLARRVRLPSGLSAVSTAALLNRLLAIDSAGSVFLSQDAGKHWETVAAQWNGKAVEVQAPPEGMFMRSIAKPGPEPAAAALEASPGGAPEEIAPPAASIPAASSAPALASAKVASKAVSSLPPMVFTLVTDRHQTWVSADGKVWREPAIRVSPPGSP